MSILTINIIMIKYIRQWINEYNAIIRETNEMGYFTLGTWYGTYTYVDKEQYRKYINARQKQISNSNNQSKK